MKIEVCVNRLEDVQRIQSLAVDRIELCIELTCGGLTPSLAMVEQALAMSTIPIHVLVRPRSGDFMYSKVMISGMKKTIEQLHDLGVAGIVTGALTKDENLPIAVLKSFRSIVSNGALYFHRAFDELNTPENALKLLIDLGYDGVLTSGQKSTALEGIHSLKRWKDYAKKELTILPGSGINASNCLAFKSKGFEWIHLSAKKEMESSCDSLFSAKQYQLDQAALSQVIKLVKA
jgi:copper homeostasis protein